MTLRTLLPMLAVSGTFALSACGGDDTAGGSAAAEQGATPERAIAEIGNVRTSLDKAVAAVKRGNAEQADEILSEGYVEHFEQVEGPLEEADHELNEQLEETLATTLREKVKGGASAADVQALVDDINADLDTAERKLR
jgi:hypothetical protein